MDNLTLNIPVLALRGLTVFPRSTMSFDVERAISVKALELAMETDQNIFLVTQKEIGTAMPGVNDIYSIGTVAHICQILRISESAVRVMVTGTNRARIKRLWQTDPFLQANIELIEEVESDKPLTAKEEALLRQSYGLFSEYATLAGNVQNEMLAKALDCKDLGALADFICQNINLRHTDKQAILEEMRPLTRLKKLNTMLSREIQVLTFERSMEDKLREQFATSQKEQILRNQINLIQQELGEEDEDEIGEYRRKVKELKLEESVQKQLIHEIDRLSKQPFGSAEAAVIRNYLDTCLDMPWNTQTKERADVGLARKILDAEHYGLQKVKERILEFIAVKQINPDAKGQIICLVGPPGVGKTSIAISVAKAVNRKMARLSLGGVRDEADIRGHRKTYIGAMPGRIIEAMIRSKSMNPLLVLDEIDKMCSDQRGDPGSALLEVLDSEQNYAFRDHFLEIPVDLSRVLFITTANTTETIPKPLLDRMEVIELSSYTDEEKLQIAKRHLFPKQLKEHGLKKAQLRISDEALRLMISGYTRESGVRKLERQLAKVCRKSAMRLVEEDVKRISITASNLKDYLGIIRYQDDNASLKDEVGIVNGLAWTQVGGELLKVEVNVMDGSGKLELTGNLGEVMQESCKAALSCLRSRADKLGIEKDFYKTKDIHVHFPEGAVPKDGPSAGIAITTAMLSALTGRAVRGDIAMTGEVTLRGNVLAIGGLKEKTMAAKRNKITTVIIPKENVKDLEEIDPTVREALKFVSVETIDAVLAEAIVGAQAAEVSTAQYNLVEKTESKQDSVLRQ